MIDDSNASEYYPRRRKWVRAILVVVILFGYSFSEALLWFLALIQFVWILFKSEPNQHIQTFSDKLVRWASSAISFCLWKTDLPPFPFAPWPDET